MPQHETCNDDHQHAERREQHLAVDTLADLRPDRGADCPRHRENSGTWPFHRSRPSVPTKVGERAGRNGHRARTDGDVGRQPQVMHHAPTRRHATPATMIIGPERLLSAFDSSTLETKCATPVIAASSAALSRCSSG